MATALPTTRRALREPHADPSPLPRPEGRPAHSGLDRQLWLALLLAAAVVFPRSFLIARAHSASYDDDYHLKRGLVFLTRSLAQSGLDFNDPPLGEGLVAVPMLVTNLLAGRSATDDRLYDVPGRAETIAVRSALWNSALFVGFLGVVFAWCRRVYGTRSAWFATRGLVHRPDRLRRAGPDPGRQTSWGLKES